MYCVLHSFVGLARPPTWILGVLLLREARGGEEAKKGNGGEGTKGGREGKGGRTLHPLPLPNSLRHCVDDQARPSRRPGLWVGDLTWLEDFLTSK